MTSAKELGIQISLHDILCGLDSYDTCTERDNVRIVVFLNKMRGRDIRAYGCTHTMNFVCCNRDTNTCSADKHRTLHLTGCNCASDFLADLRIITPFRCVNTIVYNLMSKAFQILPDLHLHLHCCMIISNSDFHIEPLLYLSIFIVIFFFPTPSVRRYFSHFSPHPLPMDIEHVMSGLCPIFLL